MLTKSQFKHIRLLSDKNYRLAQNEFVVEGHKIVVEALQNPVRMKCLVATKNWLTTHQPLIPNNLPIFDVNDFEMEKLSHFKTNPQVLAIVSLPLLPAVLDQKITLALDEVQDPGNMGTIIRIADWYGIQQIWASPGCADAYNPKVIQASMGSVLRVNVITMNLLEKLNQTQRPLFVSQLNGENIAKYKGLQEGIIIMGNESKGVSLEIRSLEANKITIPKIGQAESLNVAVATGIICHTLLS